ncbi:MAG: alpha/beta fold hydrolase [Rhizobiaceae bacterium]
MVADMYGYSRLREADEAGVLARQKAHRRELIDPESERHHGSIVKSTGDGVLVEFPSAKDSINCAVGIQSAMVLRESDIDPDRRILYRIGINVGDIVHEEGDVFGDGVNVAARLEALAEPGGVCISDAVHQVLPTNLDAQFTDLGSQKVKNIDRKIGVWQWTPEAPASPVEIPAIADTQSVRFCTSSDGAQLAWSNLGEGIPVLKAPNWFNHIEYEWRVPSWKGLLLELIDRFQFVRFDQRGNGLSEWDVDDISEDAMIADMKAVADAAGLEKFGLFALSQGGAFSVRFAAEYPERVSFLIMCGGYARGALHRGSPDQAAMVSAFETMIRQGWGSPLPTYRQVFTSMFMTGAAPEQTESFDELMRISASPENAVRIFHMNNNVNVTECAPQVKAPTLVLHCRDDSRIPFDEGKRMAALIPNAQFVALEGQSHILMPNTPAFDGLFDHVDRFIEGLDHS